MCCLKYEWAWKPEVAPSVWDLNTNGCHPSRFPLSHFHSFLCTSCYGNQKSVSHRRESVSNWHCPVKTVHPSFFPSFFTSFHQRNACLKSREWPFMVLCPSSHQALPYWSEASLPGEKCSSSSSLWRQICRSPTLILTCWMSENYVEKIKWCMEQLWNQISKARVVF